MAPVRPRTWHPDTYADLFHALDHGQTFKALATLFNMEPGALWQRLAARASDYAAISLSARLMIYGTRPRTIDVTTSVRERTGVAGLYAPKAELTGKLAKYRGRGPVE